MDKAFQLDFEMHTDS